MEKGNIYRKGEEDKGCYLEDGHRLTQSIKEAQVYTRIEFNNLSSRYEGLSFLPLEPSERKKEEITIGSVSEGIASLLEYKNKKYGGSALKPLNIFGKHHPYGSRIDEKIARVKSGDTLSKNDTVDIIGGLILICKDLGWSNFDEFKD